MTALKSVKTSCWVRRMALTAVLASSPTAYAVSMTYTINQAIALGSTGFQAYGLWYHDWHAGNWCNEAPYVVDNCVAPDFDGISVTPVDRSGPSLNNPGLRWDGGFETQDAEILWPYFQFVVEPVALATDEIFGMQIMSDQGVLVDTSWGDINSAVYPNGSFDMADTIAALYVSPEAPMDEGAFFAPQTTIWVDAFVYLGSDPGGSASLSGGYQRFPLEFFVPSVAIPAPWVLMALGFGAIGWVARRR